MNVWLLILPVTLLSAGCRSGPDATSARRFQAAEEAFSAASTPEDFERVGSMYQEILDGGFVSGTVLYNQGNAFMRAGRRGRAIAAWRQAQRYRPRDPWLTANLNQALGPQAAAERSTFERIFFWQNWFSYSEKFRMTSGFLVLSLVVSLIGQMRPSAGFVSRLRFPALVLFVLSAVSTAWDWYRIEHVQHGVVIAKETIARRGNSESYEPAYTQPLTNGVEFTVREQRGDWLLMELPDAGEGWIPARDAVIY